MKKTDRARLRELAERVFHRRASADEIHELDKAVKEDRSLAAEVRRLRGLHGVACELAELLEGVRGPGPTPEAPAPFDRLEAVVADVFAQPPGDPLPESALARLQNWARTRGEGTRARVAALVAELRDAEGYAFMLREPSGPPFLASEPEASRMPGGPSGADDDTEAWPLPVEALEENLDAIERQLRAALDEVRRMRRAVSGGKPPV